MLLYFLGFHTFTLLWKGYQMSDLGMVRRDGILVIGEDPFKGRTPQWLPKEVYEAYLRERIRVTFDLVLLDPQGRVLLGMRSHPPVLDWSLVGGFRVAGETNPQAAARIAMEEARFTLETGRPLKRVGDYEYVIGVGDVARHDQTFVWCYEVTTEEAAEIKLNRAHFTTQKWVPLHEVTLANGYPLITVEWAVDLLAQRS